MTELLWTVVRSDGFRRVVLQQLMNLTARAFGCKGKRVWTLPAHQALHTYAEFTRRQLQTPPSDELLQRMSDEACRRGRLLRRVFRLQRPADVERMLCELYRHIGIRLCASPAASSAATIRPVSVWQRRRSTRGSCGDWPARAGCASCSASPKVVTIV